MRRGQLRVHSRYSMLGTVHGCGIPRVHGGRVGRGAWSGLRSTALSPWHLLVRLRPPSGPPDDLPEHQNDLSEHQNDLSEHPEHPGLRIQYLSRVVKSPEKRLILT